MEIGSLGMGSLIISYMQDISKFESRTAELNCSDAEFYGFITDIRNFGKLIPQEVITKWQADEDSCSFSISPMGEITLRITAKTPDTSVIFSGKVLVTIAFDLTTHISQYGNGKAKARLVMEAVLSPMLKMMASGPIESFLETLVCEMEKFEKWSG